MPSLRTSNLVIMTVIGVEVMLPCAQGTRSVPASRRPLVDFDYMAKVARHCPICSGPRRASVGEPDDPVLDVGVSSQLPHGGITAYSGSAFATPGAHGVEGAAARRSSSLAGDARLATILAAAALLCQD